MNKLTYKEALHELVHKPYRRRNASLVVNACQAAINSKDIIAALHIAKLGAEIQDAHTAVRYIYGSLLLFTGDINAGMHSIGNIQNVQLGMTKFDVRMFLSASDSDPGINLIKNIQIERSNLSIFESRSTVLFAACDSVYFERFGDQFISSIIRHSPNSNIVIAKIKTDSQPEISKKSSTRQSYGSNVSIVECVLNSTVVKEHNLKTAYACCRWIIVQLLINKFKHEVNLILLDVDMQLMRPIETLVDALTESDVGLLLHERSITNAMSAVSGSICSIRNTNRGRQFINLVSNFILDAFSKRIAAWHLDQVALLNAYLMMIPHKFYPLPPNSVLSLPFVSQEDRENLNSYFHSYTASSEAIQRTTQK